MYRTNNANDGLIEKISIYDQGVQLGKAISISGSLQILESLFENSKLYTEILNSTKIPVTSLNRALKILVSINMITKDRSFSKGRETSIYSITSFGKDIIKLITRLHRNLTLKNSQKTLEIMEK